ncbi:MAG: PmoA family protein [Cyclobacteriaceae bacterium]|nr:PmoA family protein [Cyclobacteriaceae bacterium]
MKNSIFIALSLLFVFSMCRSSEYPGKTLAEFKVQSGEHTRLASLVSASLDPANVSDQLGLFELVNRKEVPVAFQIDKQGLVSWKLSGSTAAGAERKFIVKKLENSSLQASGLFVIKAEDGGYSFEMADKTALYYRAATMFPPDGVEEAYKRSGYIHPLYAPNGAELTTIQPADHYHHYGIWNPWTKTQFRGEEIDFWNLKKMDGTVRHREVLNTSSGPVFSSMKVMHEHIVWPESEKETIAMEEIQEMTLHAAIDGAYFLDFLSELKPLEDIVLEEYRYGGFGFRATEYWTNQNSYILTSEGNERAEADGKAARWCFVYGDTPNGKAGILFMGHPENYNYPEPLRVWPVNANGGRGDVFVNFSPTRNMDWPLSAGTSYKLRYRMLVFDGELDAATAEQYWNDFAYPVNVEVSK